MVLSKTLPQLFLFLIAVFTLTSCDQKFSLKINLGIKAGPISGVIRPFAGLIASSSPSFLSQAFASICTEAVYARLYRLEENGSIDLNSPIMSEQVLSDARYSFDLSNFSVDENVKYIVRVEGCDGEVFSRPITGYDDSQDVDAVTTTVSQVVNAENLIGKKLNEALLREVDELIKLIRGANKNEALNSLTSDVSPKLKFTQIFNASPDVIRNARPEVLLLTSSTQLSELIPFTYNAKVLHIDPNYSFAYSWKLNGIQIATTKNLTFTPHSNQQGYHQLDYYVGMDNGTGQIDFTKPYYRVAYDIVVTNNIPPTVPLIAISSGTLSPTPSRNVSIDMTTGISLSECSSFDSLAVTESSTAPGPMQFALKCDTPILQSIPVVLSPGDGPKNIYLWARDSSGIISQPRSVTFVLDTTGPSGNISLSNNLVAGGASVDVAFSFQDTYSSVSSIELQFSPDGSSFSKIDDIVPLISPYIWNVPTLNTTSARLRAIVSDTSGNTSIINSSSFTIDSNPPSPPSVSLNSDAVTNNPLVSLSINSCSGLDKIFVSEVPIKPSISDFGWVPCTIPPGVVSYTLSTGGDKTLYVWASDVARNVSNSASTVTIKYDADPPVITASPSGGGVSLKGGSSFVVTWDATDQSSISYELEFFNGSTWSMLTATPQSTKSFTWSVPMLNGNSFKLRLLAKDYYGRVSTAETSNVIIDSSAPNNVSISINGNATQTSNRNLLVSFSALDSYSRITSFCLKSNNSASPNLADSCWVDLSDISVTPSSSLSISSYPFQVSNIAGDYSIYAWFRDIHGHVSSLQSVPVLGADFAVINYKPDSAPVINSFIVSSSETPSSPLTDTDTTILVGSDVYVSWSITDNESLPSGSISLEYSTNDSTFISAESGLSNSSNGGCTPAIGSTGCFVWVAGSPTSSFFRFRIRVTDSANNSVIVDSNPLNTGKVRFLAGNTSLGIGAAAGKAILRGANESAYNDNSDPQALAVAPSGTVYFRFFGRGVTYISPTDGVIRDLLKQTGSSTGDGGSAFLATARDIRRISVDYQGRLLIWDHDRVRVVNPSTWQISTLFGGGSDTSNGAQAGLASIPASYSDHMAVMPNGNVYFNKGNQIWFYEESSKTVKLHLTLTGLGTDTMGGWKANFDNVFCPGANSVFSFDKATNSITKIMRKMSATPDSACGSASSVLPNFSTNFDPNTGVATAPHPPGNSWSSFRFTGLDGRIYVLDHGRASLLRYNASTNVFDTVVGGVGNGRCIDGTPAKQCRAVIMSAFVNEFGKIYFLDLGVVRTVDAKGDIQTIAGQPRNFGIGQNPINGRFSLINYFEIANNHIYIRNELENQIVRFSLAGTNLEHIAGDSSKSVASIGSLATQSPLPNCGWSSPCGFNVDTQTNRLYHYGGVGGAISYIDLSNGNWVQLSTGFQDSAARTSWVGQHNGLHLSYTLSHYGVSGDKVTLRLYDPLNQTFSIVYGMDSIVTNPNTDLCSNVSSSSCSLPNSFESAYVMKQRYDQTLGWVFGLRNRKLINYVPLNGGFVQNLTSTANDIAAHDYYDDGVTKFVYYCSTSGFLYKRNLSTQSETLLPLPVPGLRCDGNTLRYSSSRQSLFFAFALNGLSGIAEYTEP